MTQSQTYKDLVGKFVYYFKPKYAWRFAKVLDVAVYQRGPNKGQIRYVKVGHLNLEYKRRINNHNVRKVKVIKQVLKGKKTFIPFKEWLK